MIIVKKGNSSFLKISGDPHERTIIANHFTHTAPNYQFHPKYKRGQWDGKIRIYNRGNNTLPYGLWMDLLKCCKENNIEYEVDSSLVAEIKPRDITDFDKYALAGINKKYIPRDYQRIGAEEALINGRGIIEFATGSGKTLTLFLVINYIINKVANPKIMVVVPNKGLLIQFYNDFIDYGLKAEQLGKYFGTEKDSTKPITIGTWQSLRKNEEYLMNVTHALCDEVHHSKAVEVKNLLNNCINAPFRLGCTGSLPDGECDKLTIKGCFGKVVKQVKSHKLIHEDKVLSPIQITQVKYSYPVRLRNSCRNSYMLEKRIIQNYKPRRDLVKKIISKHKPKDNILILFDVIESGKDYHQYLQKKFPKREFFYVSGEIDVEEREFIRQEANKRGGVVILGSVGTLSTGININRLHSIIFLAMGKSKIRLLQSIGRALRLHKTKVGAHIWDICDQFGYSINHAKIRREIYKKERFPLTIIDEKEL